MAAPVRLALFAAVLVAVFATAFLTGRAIGPVGPVGPVGPSEPSGHPASVRPGGHDDRPDPEDSRHDDH